MKKKSEMAVSLLKSDMEKVTVLAENKIEKNHLWLR